MTRTANNSRFVALAVTTALATTALSGCATKAAPQANVSASKAQSALAKGQADKAVTHAEAAVLAAPRDASLRAMLGATYMESGRFQSAATSFGDAMQLGDNSPRVALSMALAQIAAGDSRSARVLLNDYRDDLDPSDYGLALALAGDAERGVHVLSNAIRGGQNNAKTRQNLAYAYALQGNWRSARLMAAEDVPADKINERIGEWAQTAISQDHHARVAALLDVPVVGDMGQPVSLALANHPSGEQMAAEAATFIPADEAADAALAYNDGGELPAAGEPVAYAPPAYAPPALAPLSAPVSAPVDQSVNFNDAFAASAPAAVSPVSTPQQTARYSAPAPARAPARAPAQFAAASAEARVPAAIANGDHNIQLGSFASEEGAKRAIEIYSRRYANLSSYDMVITQARVNGKNYWRVAAAGMEKSDASSMCSSVKSKGYGCIAYAAASPLPGALDRGTRMASR